MFTPLTRLLEAGLTGGIYTAAVALAGVGGELRWQAAVGRVSRDPGAQAATAATVFDLASLTKPLATALALLLLMDDGRLAPAATLGEFLPAAWLPPDKRSLSLGSLLAHRAGLPAWAPFYQEILQQPPAARRGLLPRLAAASPLVQPPDTATLYSDLGFMLLQAVVETVSGLSLDRFCAARIYRPLGLEVLGFNPLPLPDRAGLIRKTRKTENGKRKTAFTPPPKPASLPGAGSPARCTTRTPGPRGAWPGTPASSAGESRFFVWWPPSTGLIGERPAAHPSPPPRCAAS